MISLRAEGAPPVLVGDTKVRAFTDGRKRCLELWTSVEGTQAISVSRRLESPLPPKFVFFIITIGAGVQTDKGSPRIL